MKVLMISSGFPPEINTGAEKFCYELSTKLIQSGLNVEVATHTNLKKYHGIKLHSLHKIENKYLRKLFFDYFNQANVSAIRKILDDVEPDVIHFHNIYGISTQIISDVSKKYPVIVTVHDYWPFCFNSTMLCNGKICTMNCKTCRFPMGLISRVIKTHHLKNAFLVAPSNFMEKKLIYNGFTNVCTIHNAIDIPMAGSTNSNRFFYIGRLSYEKGVLFLINCAQKLKFNLDIIGKGPLVSIISEKLSASVDSNINVKGFVGKTEDEYKEGGVLIVPSIWPDNFPYVILEAMSFGLPVIGSEIGGIPEMIDHGKTGLLFKPGDEGDLEKQLRYLLDNPQKIQEFGQNAIKKVENDFNWDKTVRNYLELYNRLMN